MLTKANFFITWHIDDIQEVRPDLTEEQAREVLRILEENQNENWAVTRGTLKAHIDDLFPINAMNNS